MAKFRKKPVEVEAEQWFPGVTIPGVYPPVEGELPRHYVRTAHHQVVFLEPGDWVVQEPDGRGAYPVKPDIFAATYEPVTD
jgi:hypothetical protein